MGLIGPGTRKSNFFEKVILIVGLGIILLGLHFINSVYSKGLSDLWGLVQSVFLWLILIVMVVQLATEEDVKEELSVIMRQQVEEMHLIKEEILLIKEEYKLVKQINTDQHAELKMIRKELETHKYR
ncbi:MAG: hypothetical protein ABIJ21_01635 [Nanoarchaeota archaeon]